MRRLVSSLTARLVAGTGLIAALALVSALVTATAAVDSAARIERAVAAQERMELLAALSGRIGDFALTAVQVAGDPALGAGERADRLEARAERVREALARAGEAVGRAVEEARALDEETRMRRATQGLGLARMRAQFEALVRGLGASADPAGLRAELDSFATRFSPLLNEAIQEERRDRDAAFARARDLRGTLLAEATAVGLAAPALLAVFHVWLTRPLLRRIRRVSEATAALGRGEFAVRLDVERRDELGLLFARMNRLAQRLARRRRAVEADRARLEEIIAARTEELRAANARLEEIDAERRRFFADVGHELRTPLTVILGETDLCLRAPALDEGETRQSLGVIRTRARRLYRRIEDLLRVARSESGRIELADAPFDLADAARDALEDCEGLARRRKVSVALEGAEGPLPARGDRDWIRQVASGVIDNALRHSPEGGRVALRLSADPGELRLAVVDEGPGIPPEDRARVLERFERGRRARPGEGFGVGLSLARWIVECHSGGIEIQSPAPEPVGARPEGPGTAVAIRLPRADGEAAQE
jgi:hypothetical protein